MQMSKRLQWGLAILIVLSIAFVAQATVLQNYYLPLVYRQVPTPTPTPKTECLSGKTSGVCITDLEYKGGIDEEVISIKNLSSSVDMKDWRITSDTGNKFDITFDFLDDEEYDIEFIEDGINADTRAIDYRLGSKTIKKKDKITIDLAPGGGWIARITKKDH